MTRKRESVLREAVRDALKPLDVIAVENGEAHPGTPDQNYAGKHRWDPRTGEWDESRPYTTVEGWIEEKRAHLPQKPLTQQVKIEVQDGQRPFWARRHQAGGRVNVLLEIDSPTGRGRGLCLWFHPLDAVALIGKARLPELVQRCKLSWASAAWGWGSGKVVMPPWMHGAANLWHEAQIPFAHWIRMAVVGYSSS